jgi:hypothetical protein
MVIMSDRSKGIENAVNACCGAAQHVLCTVHLVRNVLSHCRTTSANGTIKALIYRAAEATLRVDFELALKGIKDADSDAFSYISKIDPALWAQSHSTARRFFVITSNAVESLNSVLVEARRNGPLKLLSTLYEWIFTEFGKRRAESEETQQQQFTIRAFATLREEATIGKGCTVQINGLQAQVHDAFKTFAVCLDRAALTCSCGRFAMSGLPCSHMFKAFAHIGSPDLPYSFVDRFWTMEAQRRLYTTQLPAIPTNGLTVDQQTTAPRFKPSGSRRKKRFLSSGESAVPAQHQKSQKTLTGQHLGSSATQASRAATIVASPNGVTPIGEGQMLVQRPGGVPHVVDTLKASCTCAGYNQFGTCTHLHAAAIAPQPEPSQKQEIVPTPFLRQHQQ